MQKLLRHACHVVYLARERSVSLKPALIELFRRENDILKEGLAFHEAQPPSRSVTTEILAKRIDQLD
jgi:hypothetical protein